MPASPNVRLNLQTSRRVWLQFYSENGNSQVNVQTFMNLRDPRNDASDIPEATFDILKAIFDILKATFDILKATFDILEATFDILEATFDILKATFDILEATCEIPKATRDIPEATCDILEATCDILEATRDILEATCDILEATCDIPKATRDIPKQRARSQCMAMARQQDRRGGVALGLRGCSREQGGSTAARTPRSSNRMRCWCRTGALACPFTAQAHRI